MSAETFTATGPFTRGGRALFSMAHEAATLAQNWAGLTNMLLTELRASSVAFALSSGEGIMTHVRTLAYFSAFLGTLGFVLAGFPWRAAWGARPSLLACVPYSLLALIMTWRLILSFMVNFQVPAGPTAHTYTTS